MFKNIKCMQTCTYFVCLFFSFSIKNFDGKTKINRYLERPDFNAVFAAFQQYLLVCSIHCY